MTTEQRVATWLNDLAVLTAGSQQIEDRKTRVGVMAKMLASEFDHRVFCQASLVHCASRLKFFPSYAELCEPLSAWWREHRPPPSQRLLETERQGYIPPEQRKAKLERETREARESWQNITPEEVRAKIRALDGHPMRLVLGKILHTGLARHAAHHVGLLPPEFFPNDNQPGEVVPFPNA